MAKGLRITLWVLSSLAVLWTLLALVGLFTMGCCGMMGGGIMGGRMMGDTSMMGMMRDSAMTGGMHGGMAGGGWMAGMILQMTLTWLVMLGLVGVFVSLIVTARRSR